MTGWGESPTDVLTRYAKQTPGSSGKWKNLAGTDDSTNADYYIVLEGTKISTPLDRTIYIKREPDFIRPLQNLPYKHVIDFRVMNGGVTYWIEKTYNELKQLRYPSKTKLVSCVVSNKHNHREQYVRSLFRNNLKFDFRSIFRTFPKIDLYGRGHDRDYFGESYKGELNYNGFCKYKGLVEYSYTIVLENSVQPNYWTEKLADAYLAWCMPIYWGCPNVFDYFPAGSARVISLDSSDPVRDIKKIISQPVTNEEKKLIGECRELILDRYNIWEVIYRKIKDIENI